MHVILVDKSDRVIGTEEKLKAHQEGKLHRAFSVFIFNKKKELLLQRRAEDKYHSGGLWTNTCCSHPRQKKELNEEAEARLEEEMGISCHLEEKFCFIYKVRFENGLYEHEYDHVFFGKYDGKITPNKKEVSKWGWISLDGLKKDINKNPEKYTYWLKECLDRVIEQTNSFF
jgi:isopentenyl-diphosphate Delta-isomerase